MVLIFYWFTSLQTCPKNAVNIFILSLNVHWFIYHRFLRKMVYWSAEQRIQCGRCILIILAILCCNIIISYYFLGVTSCISSSNGLFWSDQVKALPVNRNQRSAVHVGTIHNLNPWLLNSLNWTGTLFSKPRLTTWLLW